MPSITYWNRLEPDPRSKSLERSLAAEIRDPLWLLTRQWQLGEFIGEDAGSLMSVDIETEDFDLTTFGPTISPTIIQRNEPLEPQVQREPYTPDLATKVELSQMWRRLVSDFDFDSFLEKYPLPEPQPADLRDDASARFLAFVTGRAFDGFKLYLDVRDDPAAVPGASDPAIAKAMEDFQKAVEGVFGTVELSREHKDPTTWRSEKLDYQFDVRARDATTEYSLVARPDADGEIDWNAFDLASTIAVSEGSSNPHKVTLRPTHLRFPGMPAQRFWEFESGTTNFPDVSVDRRDIAKLLMLDLMLVHGVDWFLVHLPVAVGKLVRINGLVARNVFGETITIPRGEDLSGRPTERWTAFTVAGSGGEATAGFFILPASAMGLDKPGQLLEEVAFGRDETANMAWAIERSVETELGEIWAGTERAAAFAAKNPSPPLPPTTEPLRYQLGTDVPLHWIPFLPVRVPMPSEKQVALVEAEPIPLDRPSPAGRILRPPAMPNGPFSLLEEEVPREGVKVSRLIVRTRWIDGKSYLWVERRRSPGTGETQSGLRFDRAIDTK